MQAEEYKLYNAYEETVKSAVKMAIDQTEMCRCEKCFLDICAMVYNNNFTRFVTTREGELFSKIPEMSYNFKVELLVAVMDAVKKVKDNPRH